MPARILVVDDEPSARMLTSAQLEPGNWNVQVASSGAEALELTDQAPDLVICDLMMPGIDGLAVCRAIKAAHRRTPVILLTAVDDSSVIVEGLEAGADEFVSKPVEGNVLRARVRALLRLCASYVQAVIVPKPSRAELVAQAHLTEREREVLELLLLGRTHEDIGLVLGISERTARFHQTNLLAKLGAESRHDLMRVLI